jgi:hypothetical protein
MSIFIAPPEAAGIMLPILCAMDLFGAHAYRGRWSRTHLRVLLPGAIVGIGLGALAFGALSVNAVRLLLGLIAVTFALNKWFGLAERFATRVAAPGRVAGVFWGGAAGFTSTLAHAGGPPFAVYMLPQRLDRRCSPTSVVLLRRELREAQPYAFLSAQRGQSRGGVIFAPLARSPGSASGCTGELRARSTRQLRAVVRDGEAHWDAVALIGDSRWPRIQAPGNLAPAGPNGYGRPKPAMMLPSDSAPPR